MGHDDHLQIHLREQRSCPPQLGQADKDRRSQDRSWGEVHIDCQLTHQPLRRQLRVFVPGVDVE